MEYSTDVFTEPARVEQRVHHYTLMSEMLRAHIVRYESKRPD